MKIKPWFIAILAVGLFFPRLSHAVNSVEAPPDTWGAHSYGLLYNASYFGTNSNYNYNRGSFTSLINNNYFATFESHLLARYNPTRRFSFFGGSGFASSQAIDTGVTKTSTNLTDVFVGVDFLALQKFVHIIPELRAGYPVDQVNASQSNPLTSDGTSYVRGGLWGYLPFKRLRLGGFAGVHWPTQNLATRFLYEANVDVRLFWYLTAGAGIDGYETIISDTTNYATRVSTAISADAGSERFYGFNPALVEARAWIGFRPNRSLWVRAGYAQTINGEDSAYGQSVLLSIAYDSPGDMAERTTDFRDHPDRAVREFESEIEPTEQEIFSDQDAQTKGATQPKPKKPAPPKVAPKNDHGQTLDQTEKMLEQKNRNEQE